MYQIAAFADKLEITEPFAPKHATPAWLSEHAAIDLPIG